MAFAEKAIPNTIQAHSAGCECPSCSGGSKKDPIGSIMGNGAHAVGCECPSCSGGNKNNLISSIIGNAFGIAAGAHAVGCECPSCSGGNKEALISGILGSISAQAGVANGTTDAASQAAQQITAHQADNVSATTVTTGQVTESSGTSILPTTPESIALAKDEEESYDEEYHRFISDGGSHQDILVARKTVKGAKISTKLIRLVDQAQTSSSTVEVHTPAKSKRRYEIPIATTTITQRPHKAEKPVLTVLAPAAPAVKDPVTTNVKTEKVSGRQEVPASKNDAITKIEIAENSTTLLMLHRGRQLSEEVAPTTVQVPPVKNTITAEAPAEKEKVTTESNSIFNMLKNINNGASNKGWLSMLLKAGKTKNERKGKGKSEPKGRQD